MLKYNIRISSNIGKSELSFSDAYVDPTLRFISGVTSTSYALENYDSLLVYSTVNGKSESMKLSANNVTREGYVILRGFKYPVNQVKVSRVGRDVDYVYVNGTYFYKDNSGKFNITRWLTENFRKEKRLCVKRNVCEPDEREEKTVYIPSPVEKTISVSDSGGYISVDKICWIYDGRVEIDGNEYIFDPEEASSDGSIGGLRYGEDGPMLTPSEIAGCESIDYVPFEFYEDRYEVTKFTLFSDDDDNVRLDNVSCMKYYSYVVVDETEYPVKCDGSRFYVTIDCKDYELYYTEEMEDGTEASIKLVPGEHSVDGYGTINNVDDLYDTISYIIYNGTKFSVKSTMVDVKYGSLVALYLSNPSLPYNIGDKVSVIDGSTTIEVYGEGSDEYVVFNGKKYFIIQNLIQKAEIDGVTYEAEVTSNGINVLIENEWVPMELNGNDIKRYGKVIDENGNLKEQTGKLVTTPGFLIEGVKIDALDFKNDDDSPAKKYIDISGIKNRIPFIVTRVVGSSLLVCEPDLKRGDFNDGNEMKEFKRILCGLVSSNKANMSLNNFKNVLGDKEITPDIGFLMNENPSSSNDYYDPVNDIKIYANTGVVSMTLPIGNAFGNNVLQSEIVEHDFHERVLEESINKITNLEKDIYVPKYIPDVLYNGSKTDFSSIYEIRVNLHFRTRNLDNWKVIEKANEPMLDVDNDNWFITDYEPYKTIISNGTESNREKLMKMSDLMGFLGFDNNDIFYQKSRVAKSFLRFSFYDSPNPQNQMLLSTSTVFMDEHDLYKRFIDNSKSGCGLFTMTSEDASGCSEVKKINVLSEKGTLTVDGNDITKYSEINIDSDSTRLSSRFTIKNKYETDTSSEGFYMYMFKDYSEKLHPKPIYMKVEFNHAGIGRTVPFVIPMKWDETDDGKSIVPTKRLTLSGEDLEILKEGVPLSMAYQQSYIPLYGVYDYKNREYVYVFDNRYVSVNETDNSIDLNLFEMKIRDDSNTRRREKSASINLNTQQFAKEAFLNNG